MRQPVTLFGEGDEERYMRLLALEEKQASGMKKTDKDETSTSFMPQDEDVELLRFIKN